VLAIDEPTNHIDAKARQLLIDALECYRGVGLIVSHDRDLLDALCTQCIWLEPPNTLVVPGGYTKARAQKDLNRASALRERNNAVRERKRLEREGHKRREQAARSHQDRSKGGLAIKDHDARFKKNLARISGKDGQAGRLLRQLDGRAEQSQVRVDAAKVNKEHDVGIWLPGSRSRRTTLLQVEAGTIALGDGRMLRFPQLMLKPEDRVAVTGLNGLGKSTLIRHLLSQVSVPVERLTVLPQEVDAARARALLDEARDLPRRRLGQVMNVVSRLGSRPERLLKSRQPSPGELRKLLLALGMANAPHLIVMDEPTNHLDLPSIEALEQALADCPCALLLVSHDQRFLDALVDVTWHIEGVGNRDSELRVI
jgi:macrolide transport system ATP-binding/permease protein